MSYSTIEVSTSSSSAHTGGSVPKAPEESPSAVASVTPPTLLPAGAPVSAPHETPFSIIHGNDHTEEPPPPPQMPVPVLAADPLQQQLEQKQQQQQQQTQPAHLESPREEAAAVPQPPTLPPSASAATTGSGNDSSRHDVSASGSAAPPPPLTMEAFLAEEAADAARMEAEARRMASAHGVFGDTTNDADAPQPTTTTVSAATAPPGESSSSSSLTSARHLGIVTPVIAQHDYDKTDVKMMATTSPYTFDELADLKLRLAPLPEQYLQRMELVPAVRQRLLRSGEVRQLEQAGGKSAHKHKRRGGQRAGAVTVRDFSKAVVGYKSVAMAVALGLWGSVLYHNDLIECAQMHFLRELRQHSKAKEHKAPPSGQLHSPDPILFPSDANVFGRSGPVDGFADHAGNSSGAGTHTDSSDPGSVDAERLKVTVTTFFRWLNEEGVDVLVVSRDRLAASCFAAKRRYVRRSRWNTAAANARQGRQTTPSAEGLGAVALPPRDRLSLTPPSSASPVASPILAAASAPGSSEGTQHSSADDAPSPTNPFNTTLQPASPHGDEDDDATATKHAPASSVRQREPLRRVLLLLEYDVDKELWAPLTTSWPIRQLAAAEQAAKRHAARERKRAAERAARQSEERQRKARERREVVARMRAWQKETLEAAAQHQAHGHRRHHRHRRTASDSAAAATDAVMNFGELVVPAAPDDAATVGNVLPAALSPFQEEEEAGAGAVTTSLAGTTAPHMDGDFLEAPTVSAKKKSPADSMPFAHMRYPNTNQTDCGVVAVLKEAVHPKLFGSRLRLLGTAPLGFLCFVFALITVVYVTAALRSCIAVTGTRTCILEEQVSAECLGLLSPQNFESQPKTRFLYGPPMGAGNVLIVVCVCSFVGVVANVLTVFFAVRALALRSRSRIFHFVTQAAHVVLCLICVAFAAYTVYVFQDVTNEVTCEAMTPNDVTLCTAAESTCPGYYHMVYGSSRSPATTLALSCVLLALCVLHMALSFIPAMPGARVVETLPGATPVTDAFVPGIYAPDGLAPAEAAMLREKIQPHLRRHLEMHIRESERTLTHATTIGEMMQANREEALLNMELNTKKHQQRTAGAWVSPGRRRVLPALHYVAVAVGADAAEGDDTLQEEVDKVRLPRDTITKISRISSAAATRDPVTSVFGVSTGGDTASFGGAHTATTALLGGAGSSSIGSATPRRRPLTIAALAERERHPSVTTVFSPGGGAGSVGGRTSSTSAAVRRTRSAQSLRRVSPDYAAATQTQPSTPAELTHRTSLPHFAPPGSLARSSTSHAQSTRPRRSATPSSAEGQQSQPQVSTTTDLGGRTPTRHEWRLLREKDSAMRSIVARLKKQDGASSPGDTARSNPFGREK